ncbi:competence type IV pilus minor pilin ComGF [Fructilactobacillus vespulae]|uniref:competence type IV pilus minor pilin ComGF n=1 Tax=Fructilactobacillus vespulae TaxID=1249630 RepID=UPI0039B69046
MIEKRQAFSLVETLVSLVIISLAISIMMITLNQINLYNKNNIDTNSLYRYIDLLESDQYNFEVLDVTNNKVKLYSTSKQRNYNLTIYKDVIRLATTDGGYMPLLNHAQSTKWMIKDDYLFSEITIGGKKIETKIHVKTKR